MARNRKRRSAPFLHTTYFLRHPALVSCELLEERIQLSAVTVNNNLDVVNGNTTDIASLIANDGGDGISLREAIIAANNTTGNDDIDFDAALSGSTIDLTGSYLHISDDVTITGLGANQLTIDGNNLSRLFLISDGTAGQINVEISGLTLTGGVAVGGDGDSNGAAIFNQEDLTLADSTISGNSADRFGGGIYHMSGSLTVTNSTIAGNSAQYGAGIFNHSTGSTTVSKSTISGNTASYFGGGIYLSGGSVNVRNTTISGNEATLFGGGGLANYTGTVNVTNSTIAGNEAKNNGGGIYNADGTMSVVNSTVSGNTVEFFGGGLYNSTGTLTVTNSTISGNSSTAGDGGGIRNFFGTVNLHSSTITGNSVANQGGGIFNYSGSTVNVSNTIIAGNTAVNIGKEFRNHGTFNADGNNLFGHSGLTNADAFHTFTPGASDLTATSDGTTPTALSAILHTTLADNGGPTLTHRLVAGSPALDAGDNSLLPADIHDLDGDANVAEAIPFDQRGLPFVRESGALDIGAYESQSAVVIDGTAGDDEITVSLGTPYMVTINGEEYSLGSTGVVSQITVHGFAGNDTLHVIGTPGIDNVTLNPGVLELLGTGITVDADSFESIEVASGGGQDRAFLWDSVGNDTYTASPTSATLEGTGYSNTVIGFRRAYAYSYAGGFDTVEFTDSAGVDNFVGEEARSWMTSSTFYNSASRFDRVEAFSTSPFDLAMMWDSAGNDVFTVEPDMASMTGTGFENIAHNFWRAYGYSYVGGTDQAHLYDSAADDRFIARDIRSTIQDDALTYYGSASRFEEVYSYAQNGGNDRADLFGNANSDTLVSLNGVTTMSASNYYYEVHDYEAVNGYAGAGGTDNATTTDSAGNDYFLNIPTSSYVVWDDNTRVSLFDFDAVDFNAINGGNDVAEFWDLGTLDDVFGQDDLIEITRNNGTTATATGMDEAIAESLAAPGPSTNLNSLDYVFTQTGTWS